MATEMKGEVASVPAQESPGKSQKLANFNLIMRKFPKENSPACQGLEVF